MAVKLSWSSIFGGAVAILGTAGFFHLLANGVGFSSANFVKDGVGGGTRFVTFIYYLVTMCVSFYVGGAVSSRLTDHISRFSAMVHAIVAWALAGTVTLAFGAFTNASINRTLYGMGTNTLNWLLIAICALGCAACIGGAISQRLISRVLPERERYRPAA